MPKNGVARVCERCIAPFTVTKPSDPKRYCNPKCSGIVNARARATHDESNRSPEYRTWGSMKSRCSNPNVPAYPRYGGRGITVCDRWRNSFEAFLADMGRRPSLQHSIDRIDNDGNYEPGNCRWATPTEQQRNRSTNRPVTMGGETHNVTEWAEAAGTNRMRLYARLELGWSPDRALTQPVRGNHLVTFNGETRTLTEWATSIGLKQATLRRRLKRGWSIEQSLTEPLRDS